MVFMSKNYIVAISGEVRQTALVKAAEAQKRLGRRVTIQETVEAGVKLLESFLRVHGATEVKGWVELEELFSS